MLVLVLQIKMYTKGQQLHERLQDENGGEKVIEYLEGVGECLRHHVKLHGHRDDVQADYGSYRQIEILGSYDVVNEEPRFRVIRIVRWLVHF